ncbi:hypothetical protein K227x_41120 [Rubripirellula lacrimiformis]|uniref:Uncharacterized protein n=1 Tax=Rubripirellula lacrimiformis TaxID=1930273 RepID=A0A517NF05_9BACT|nr:hypothetical protein [Rubripirellula lacrimiformis]QDT05709.1 hypothetical protein K227x_41120 [Rubripirellula lacrimiformis]
MSGEGTVPSLTLLTWMIVIAYHDAVAAEAATTLRLPGPLSQFRCFHDTAVGAPFMSNDPFARFESSRGGWLIPILLFVIGALGTMVGIRAIHGLEVPSTQQESTQDDLPQSESATSEPSGIQRTRRIQRTSRIRRNIAGRRIA